MGRAGVRLLYALEPIVYILLQGRIAVAIAKNSLRAAGNRIPTM
jgi:hypothetical protein